MNSYAQSPNVEDLWEGAGNFILGFDRSNYGSDLKYINGDTLGVKKSYGYEYLPAQNTPFILEGVKFTRIWLWFDEKNKLGSLEMLAVYKKTDSTNYLQEAEQGAYQIILYLTNTLKRKGVEMFKLDKENASQIQYEWKKNKRRMSLSMVQGKIPGHEFVDLFWGLSITQD